MSAPIYAIPDIHGHAEALDRALRLIEADGGSDAEIVFLGDLVDRGPDSRGVVERLSEGRAQGRRWHVLSGNHDHLFVRFLRDGSTGHPRLRAGLSWLHPRLGGAETLASYGIALPAGPPASASGSDPASDPASELAAAARAAVPARHRRFLEALPRHLERDGLLFVHAGIRPGLPLARQDPDDLIWIRAPFLDHAAPHPWLVVHGHTALKAPRHFGNRIDLDGGAGFGRPLCVAVFEGRACWLLTGRGRVPLRP